MADNLTAFLRENAKKTENVKVFVSDRFAGEDGKPIKWEIKALTSAEDKVLRNSCYTDQNGAFDGDEYISKLTTACVVYPNLCSKALQDSYGVMGAEAVLEAMLIPGELTELKLAVKEVNGFDKSQAELVDEAKN